LPAHIRAMKARPDNPLQSRARELGIKLVERDVIPSSRRAHECTEYARGAGKLAPFHAALLAAYWTEGKDIHAWEVLAEAAIAAGLDAAAMREQVARGDFTRAVEDRIDAARDLGIAAVPTFVLDDRVMIQGAQTVEVFEHAIRRLAARR
jgi:predicted DsbA family dithiol-disulfide isomerase